MKFKRLLSSVLAVTMAISSVAMSAFTALAADTDNVELKFTQGNCTSDGGKMKYAVDGSWAPQKVMEADSLAYLKSGNAEIKTITGTVTVTGTVAEPFYMYICYADGSGNAYWGEGNSANKKTSEESPLISEAGTYEFTLTLDEVTSPTAVNYIGFDGSANSYKNNPDAVVHTDSIVINKTVSESSSKVVITDFAGDTTFVDSATAGYQGEDFVELMINDTNNNTTILTDDQKAKITAIADSIKTITYEIEVTGTVASEFTILPCVNGGSWNITRGSNRGGMFINNYNCTVDNVKVTGPATYTVTTTVNDGISSSEILNKMWYLTSLEYHSKSFNPDMVMKLKSLTVEGAAAVTPEIDYTALDKAIADGEAVDTTAYTESSAKALTDAIAAAKAVKENTSATQDDVDAAAKAITDAIAGLEEASRTVLWTANVSATSSDSVTATLYDDYELVFSGTGAIKANSSTSKPWVTAGYENNTIKKVTVEEGITALGNYFLGTSSSTARYKASAVKEISLPSTLTTIGTYAFEYCTAISELDLSKTSVKTIGIYSFRYMTALNSIKLPDTLESVGSGASAYTFANDTSLTELDLSNTKITEIPGYMVSEDSGLTSIKLPNTVKTLSNYALANLSNLTSIDLPDSITTMGTYVFRSCTALEEVSIPNGVATLNATFNGCTGLTKVVIPPSVTKLDANVFYQCTNPDLKIYVYSTLASLTNTAFGSSSSSYSVRGTVYVCDQATYDLIDTTASARNNFTLVLDPDLTKLRDAIKNYAAHEASDYTEASFSAYTTAYNNAKELNDNYTNYPNYTADAISALVTAINEAEAALVLVDNTANVASLKETYELYNALAAVKDYSDEYQGYDEASYKAFTEALSAAGAALENMSTITNSKAVALKEAIISTYKALKVNLSYELESFGDIHGGTSNYTQIITSDDINMSGVVGTSYVKVTYKNVIGGNIQYNGTGMYISVDGGATSLANTGKPSGSYTTGAIYTYKLNYAITDASQTFKLAMAHNGWTANDVVVAITGIEFYDANDTLLYAVPLPKVDYKKAKLSDLNTKITEVETAIASGNYTELSLSVLNTVLSEAKTAAAGTDEESEVYSVAINELTAALAAAVTVTPEIDYTELDAAIAIAEAVDADAYTAESYAALTTALGAAKAVKDNADATQDDVDAAAKAITDAINALEEKPSEPSNIVLPDSGAWSRTSITNSAKLEFSPYSGNGNAVSALSGKNEFYATFTVTGVPEGGVRAYLPTVFVGGGSHWNADDVVPFVEIPTDGTYTVKFSGESIPDPAKLQYCGINFKGLTNSTDVKVGSIELVNVTLTAPAAEDPNKVVITDFTGDTTFTEGDGSYVAKGIIMLPVKYSNSLNPEFDTCILSDSDIAKIEALMPNISKIGFKVEVTGTVAKEFTLVPEMSGDGWYVSVGSNRGGPYLSTSGAAYEGVKISAPGTYELVITVDEGKTTPELRSIIIKSIEYSSKTNNPDATLVLKEMYVEGAAAVTPEIDYTALDKAIADGEAVDTTKYTEATAKALTDAIAAAKAVKENASATQDDVDAAAKAITDAINALKIAIDYTELDTAIAIAEAVDADAYTAESYAALTTALGTAKAVKENTSATQDDVDAAAKAITDAINALEEIPVDDGIYVKVLSSGTEDLSKRVLAKFAEGTANAAMAGATQIKVTFDMGPNAAFNQYMSFNVDGDVAGTTSTEKIKGNSWTNGEKNKFATVNLPKALAEGDAYSLSAWTAGFSNCNTEDNFVFGIKQAEFLDANGNVLYTHTQVEGPAAEDPNKVVVNGSEAFINQSNQFYLTLRTSGSDSNLISDDEWAKIQALAPNYTKFTFEVEVTGTVATPFTLVPRLDTKYSSDYDYWYIKPDANRGGPFISKDSDVTFESFKISEPGTYKLEVILADGTRTSELSDLVTISSLEYNTYTDNPDATVTFKSFTVEGAAAVTPEIDYTELDTAIAIAEAVDSSAYTAESYAVLTTALGTAKTVRENADATQDDVDAAAKAITDAINALEEIPVEDGLYAKVYFNGYAPSADKQIVIAQGTANAAMAGATQVKVTFDMGANCAYNQMTKLNIAGTAAGQEVKVALAGNGWPANGVKGNEKTFDLPSALAAGDEYLLRGWTENWEKCNSEDNFVFGIAKVEFLNANGDVLYTHTQVQGPAAEASNKLTITGFDGKFVDSTDFGYQSGGMLELQINTSRSTGEVKSILTDDQKAWITENADAITSITYEVEVAGTLDSPITLVTNSNGGEWNTNRYSTRGGYIINDYNCKTTSSQISEAGTYTVNVAVGRGYSSAELLNKAWYITTLESNSFTNNPNATLTLKNLVISTEPYVIDYTALDKAIADAEALEASTYTASSWSKVTSALSTAKNIKDNTHASQESIDNAAKSLNDAINALEIKPNLDYSKLEEAIKTAKEVDTSKYSSETAKALTDAIKAGEALLDSATATQTDVDAAVKAITDAQNNLVEKNTITVYIQSGRDLESAEVEVNGAGDYSAQITLNGSYWYGNLGGFMLTPCPEEGANYTIDVNSIVITADRSSGTKYTLIPSSNNTGIVPTGDMTRTDTNGLPNKGFDTDTIYASNEDGTAVLKPYDSSTMRFLVNGSMTKIYYVTYNFTLKEKVERTADWTEADKWYAVAKDLLANHKDEYTASGIADIEYAINTYDRYADNPELGQSTVDWLANLMKLRIEGAEKPSVNTALADLAKTIKQAEAIDTSEYTEETVAKLTEALEAAKAMDENSAYDDVRAADAALKNAISGLKSLPLDPFAYIYKKGQTTTIANGNTDDAMAGATQIRFTFDCADDVSYNEYASIEFKATVNGTESYKKYPGTNGYTTGAKGLTETLDLTNPIAAGNTYRLEGYTYAWEDASDYVYAVTKVEFIDADGNVVKTIKKPEEISLDELNKAIEKAEAIDTAPYTDETVKALTGAIAAAKKVTTTSTEEEAQAAIDAINAAIEALELKPVVTTFKVTGTVVVSDNKADTEMTLVAEAADGTKVTTTATSMGEYVLEGLAAGEYTLTISGGKYVERTYEITVTDGDIAMEVNLNPLGDVNGDGKITTADVGMANSHAKGVMTLEGYAFACADVRTDGTISTADVGMINSHAKGVKTLW